jgi:hypothetical protein
MAAEDRMSWLFGLLAVVPAALPAGEAVPAGSSVYRPAFSLDDTLRGPAVPYCPQPGDLCFSTGLHLTTRVGHRLALTGPPNHSGIVFARPDGTMAVLEAGPHDISRIVADDLIASLSSYEDKGSRVFVRRRMVPLTPCQSERLTAFALNQDGKRFSWGKIFTQVTPLRARGPLRTWVVGKPQGGDQRSYYCTELVLEALLDIGVLDPATTRPSATYPRDLFFGDSPNPYLHRHLTINCGWHPPQRWTTRPVGVCELK